MRWIVAVIVVVCTLTKAEAKPQPAAPAPGSKPNIIVILADDLGWTGLHATGSDLYQTPNLDKFMTQGMRFTSGYAACTVCSPTRASIMTGKYPARLHLTDFIPGQASPHARLTIPDWNKRLELEEKTVTETMKEAGYATAIIGKWHLGDGEFGPWAQGFDVTIPSNGAAGTPTYFLPNKLPTPGSRDGEYMTDYLGRMAAQQIEQWRDRPFFMYLAHFAVHTPIEGKPDLITKYKGLIKPGMKHDNPVYAAMTESLDDAVGEVLRKLDELKLTDNTIVIFTGDNGGLSVKDGKPTGITVNDPLRRGKGSAYEGGTREPWCVRWPGVTTPGSVCDEPICTVDIYPTIADIVGAALPANVDGRSIVPLLRDPSAHIQRELYWHYPHYHAGGDSPYGAVRSGDWKLIEFYEDMRVELYNLKDDLSEAHDLASKLPQKADELRTRLHAWRTSVNAQMPTPNPAYDPNAAPKKKGKKNAKED